MIQQLQHLAFECWPQISRFCSNKDSLKKFTIHTEHIFHIYVLKQTPNVYTHRHTEVDTAQEVDSIKVTFVDKAERQITPTSFGWWANRATYSKKLDRLACNQHDPVWWYGGLQIRFPIFFPLICFALCYNQWNQFELKRCDQPADNSRIPSLSVTKRRLRNTFIPLVHHSLSGK